MKKTIFEFLVDQMSTVPAVEHVDLTGKTVVVVGANTGIGLEATRHFARMNPAKLVLGCRSERRGAAAISDIASTTGFQSCQLMIVDLADFSSVVRFADTFEQECDRLDVLVMNAAIQAGEYEETVDGWESSIQVNHLGTALLSLLLLPRLVNTGRQYGSTSRLVIVASEVHHWAVLPHNVENPVAKLSGPDYRDAASMRRRYFETKLMNVLFARALQDRVQSITPLTVNAVNPGYCLSSLRRNLGTFARIVDAILEFCLARTSEQGSRQLVCAAIGQRDDEGRLKGAYVSSMKVEEPSDFVMSAEGREMQDTLWRETMDVLKQKVPQLESIVQEYLV